MKKPKVPPLIKFKNKPDDQMIIGAYVEPLIYGKYIDEFGATVTKEQAYDQLKDCGINTLFQAIGNLNSESHQATLDMFEELSKRGMNFLFRDKNIVGTNNLVTDKPEQELVEYFKQEYIPLAQKYSAFAGMHYIDEPGWKDWKRAREIKRAFKSVFPDKLFYLNLLPIYSPAWAFPNGPVYLPDADWWAPDNNDYIKYYDSYMAECDPEAFSYDFYPCSKEYPNLLDGYFKQLHLSYNYSKNANIPLICFIQNGSWDEFSRVPTQEESRWLLNTALAYNTKAICYFTYWSFCKENRGMCIDLKGNKTDRFDFIKQLNDELKFISKYIVNSAFCGYILVGSTPNGETPAEEERLQTFGNLKAVSGGNLFIGCFYYHDGDIIKNMYIIVNNSTTQNANSTITFSKTVKGSLIHRNTLTKINADDIKINLSAGDAYILIEDI